MILASNVLTDKVSDLLARTRARPGGITTACFNPFAPSLFAVGCEDPLVRVVDLRWNLGALASCECMSQRTSFVCILSRVRRGAILGRKP